MSCDAAAELFDGRQASIMKSFSSSSVVMPSRDWASSGFSRQSFMAVETMAKPARSRALETAESWVTMSRQDAPPSNGADERRQLAVGPAESVDDALLGFEGFCGFSDRHGIAFLSVVVSLSPWSGVGVRDAARRIQTVTPITTPAETSPRPE